MLWQCVWECVLLCMFMWQLSRWLNSEQNPLLSVLPPVSFFLSSVWNRSKKPQDRTVREDDMMCLYWERLGDGGFVLRKAQFPFSFLWELLEHCCSTSPPVKDQNCIILHLKSLHYDGTSTETHPTTDLQCTYCCIWGVQTHIPVLQSRCRPWNNLKQHNPVLWHTHTQKSYTSKNTTTCLFIKDKIDTNRLNQYHVEGREPPWPLLFNIVGWTSERMGWRDTYV